MLKLISLAVCVLVLINAPAAYAQYAMAGPGGAYYYPGYLNQPVFPPPVYPSPQPPELALDTFHFYKPVCHNTPGIWGWRLECAY
jgi:hypothetical protein